MWHCAWRMTGYSFCVKNASSTGSAATAVRAVKAISRVEKASRIDGSYCNAGSDDPIFLKTKVLSLGAHCATLLGVSAFGTLDQAPPHQPALPQTLPEWALELISAAALLLQWGLVSVAFLDLPAEVPKHFDAAGQPDAWGPRIMVWLLPIINLAVYGLLGFVSRKPHVSNLPIEVTPRNADRIYRLVRFQTVWLKAFITGLLAYMSWRTIEKAQGSDIGLGSAFLPVTVVGVSIVLAWFYVKVRQAQNER